MKAVNTRLCVFTAFSLKKKLKNYEKKLVLFLKSGIMIV